MKKNLSDESNKKYWASMAEVHRRVDEWPEWKKGEARGRVSNVKDQIEKKIVHVRQKTGKIVRP